MYEIFMTTTVEDADFTPACSVLEGLCSMKPWESVIRVLYYQGPPRPAGLSNQTSMEKPIRKNLAPLWRELHQNLSRQAFVLQARYEILKHRDFGPEATPMDLDATPGILRWTDFPDPPHGKPLLTQRKLVELWEQRALPSILNDNQHQYAYTFPQRTSIRPANDRRRLKGETIEETYRFFREDVEFSLTRHYMFKSILTYQPHVSGTGRGSPPATSLPAWDDITPVDSQWRWIVQVKTHVLQDNKPDEIRKAQDTLIALRNELDGVFDFRAIDRKVFDTRIVLRQQGV
ncbi:Mediator complex subunit Med18 [Cordyceps militaris CM01]|uniref:Mediator of RNA polymerase II transcription subunit 18 n=1 Tax=Cordyceps militaris (strain CM01) TaxID=983644 RepID=G3JRV7_CORMM|nr:Mediator complex subunit Med18 [Cordyceps militaris CM01]EGX88550.1 Mediator complex subunit Med18 [Cordyceps militaris CM01]